MEYKNLTSGQRVFVILCSFFVLGFAIVITIGLIVTHGNVEGQMSENLKYVETDRPYFIQTSNNVAFICQEFGADPDANFHYGFNCVVWGKHQTEDFVVHDIQVPDHSIVYTRKRKD